MDAFLINWIVPLFPHVDAFEQEFAAAVGSRHAVGRRARRGGGAQILCVFCGSILNFSICRLRRENGSVGKKTRLDKR
ncbi:MAG: hypothetical protein KGS73_04110 [Chloroflexi bacterium]|nr:hypothetical protein [Chloroflexota bacterium]